MSSRPRLILLIAAACVLAGWLGHRSAYTSSAKDRTAKDSASLPTRASHSARRPVEKTNGTLEDLRRLRSRPSTPDTSTEAWTIINRLSIPQIKETLAAIRSEGDTGFTDDQERMLYFCWARMNPQEALESAIAARKGSTGFNGNTMVLSALTAWMKADPETAFRWAMTSPAVNKKYSCSQLAKHLGTLPVEESLEKAKAYPPDVSMNLLSGIGESMNGTAADREAFLALLARSGSGPDVTRRVMRDFVRGWAASDPVTALAGLKDLPLADNELRTGMEIAANQWARNDPAAAIAWLGTQEKPREFADPTQIYTSWLDREPEQAAMEFEKFSRQSPGFRDEIMHRFLASYYLDWDDRDAATDHFLISNIKTHYDLWAASEPEQAATWLGGLDPALRQKLSPPDAHEKK